MAGFSSDPLRVEGDHGGHPLAGFASADESAKLVRHYRFAVERMMRILDGWIALTPELSAKLLFGRHVWDNAQHADLLGKRLPELRAQAHVSEPATPAFAAFMRKLEEPSRPEQTVERLVGVYGVLKPHLLACYEDHLRRVNAVYEPPTERILARLIEDERRHVHAGATTIRHLSAAPASAERAAAWRLALEAELAASGGVTGAGLLAFPPVDDAPAPSRPSDDARQFIRLEQSPTRWPVPEALARALDGLGRALVAGDAVDVGRWLAPGVDGGADLATRLAGT